jgi:hypothetical protein
MPVVQTTTGSPLVAGAAGANPAETTMHVRAIRSFMHAGKAVPVGTALDLPRSLARELIANGKAAENVAGAETPQFVGADIEMNAESAADPVRPRRGRPPKTKE